MYSTHSTQNIHGISNLAAGIWGWGNAGACGGGSTVVAEGKGAYNDTIWMQYTGGPLLWGSPIQPDGNDNKSYYGIGMTMQDITTDCSYVYKEHPTNTTPIGINGPDNGSGGCDVGNVIWPDPDLDAQGKNRAENLSYYAIILFPTIPNQTYGSVLSDEYKFKLHMDMRSEAWKKIIGPAWPVSYYGSSAYSSSGGNAYTFSSWNGSNSTSFCTNETGELGWYLAQSNTGMMHHMTGTGGVVEDRAYGGIMDGEFITLDDPWWSGDGTSYNNPWGVELLSALQKHMIRESCYQRLDTSLQPSNKNVTILITKTPAAAPSYNKLQAELAMFAAGETNEQLSLFTDNPYFNLHVTSGGGAGQTIVFRDVATGIQDNRYGGENAPPYEEMGSFQSGLGSDDQTTPIRSESQGMTISAELVKDWESYIFGSSGFSWSDVKVHTLRTVDWDSYMANTGGGGSTSSFPNLMSPTGVIQGNFYELDARVYLGLPDGAFENRMVKHLYGDATDDAGCVGDVHGKKPIMGYGGHGNVISSSNLSTISANGGWVDNQYAYHFIGLKAVFTPTTVAYFNFPNGDSHPEVLCSPTNLFQYNTSIPNTNCTYVDHSTGNYIWPDTTNSNWTFESAYGVGPQYTNHSVNSKNQWAICTGNGMVYNTTPDTSQQPILTAQVADCPVCDTGNGVVNVVLTNIDASGVEIDDISFSPAATTSPITPTGNLGTIYASTTWSFFIGVGTYTVTVVTVNHGTYTSSFTMPNCEQISFNLDSVVVGAAVTCTSPGGFRGKFDASNLTGTTISNCGGLQWTVWEWDVTNSTWIFHSAGHPFKSSVINFGIPGSGVPIFGANHINNPGATVNNKEFLMPGISGGTYRVTLTNRWYLVDANEVWADFDLVGCYDHVDIVMPSTVLNATVTHTSHPVCNSSDREENFTNCYNTTTNTGYITNCSGLTPSNMGEFDIDITGIAYGLFTIDHINPCGLTYTSSVAIYGGTATYGSSSGNTFQAGCNHPSGPISPGTHIINMTDAAGCTTSVSITINEPGPMIKNASTTQTHALCSGGNGSLSGLVVDTTMSCASMQYAVTLGSVGNSTWTNTDVWDLTPDIIQGWQSSSTFNLPAGTYRIWARNSCGCLFRDVQMTIEGGGTLASTIAVTNPGCSGGIASITVSASGGTGPYTYDWTTVTTGTSGVADPLFVAPATSSNSFTQAVPGGTYDYECLVQDANGCTQTLTASTIAGAPLTLTAVVSSISCAGGSNGAIDTTVTGGIGPYTYAWSGSSSATSADLTSLGVGTYTVLVTDSTPGTPCTTTGSWTIASTGGSEAWVDINQYAWSGYNTPYGDSITQSTANDNTYGMYGGPTCPGDSDGTIRLMLDDSTPVVGASFPFEVWLSNDGGATYYQATDNSGVNLSVLTTDLVTTGTGIVASTSAVYDPQTASGTVDYFEITGNSDKWNPGGGAVVLPFTENSTWHVKLIETGVSACSYEFSTTILPSDYRNVYNQLATTQPTCCGCSSYGASIGTNVCNGEIDNTPIRGTYEDHTNTNYTYLWTYATLASTCSVPGHNNTNTQWSNITTQDLTAEWPGIYTVVVTDSCGGTDTDTETLNDPIVYIDDITWVPPQCAGCCTGTLTITAHGGNGTLEVSLNNGISFTPITSPHTFTNMCGGINSIWVKDGSSCVVEYFADPNDVNILSSYDDNCFANANTSSIISTSGSWIPTYNNPNLGVATANAFTESSSTKIELIPVSDFSVANACIISHNIIPGDTNGEIRLTITGGTAPYEIGIVAQAGPFYTPSIPMNPCYGIGPLTTTSPCLYTGDPISNYGPSLDTATVMTYAPWGGGASNSVSSSTAITTSLLDIRFSNVSVSRDLGYGALGAEYIFYVRDAHGCYQTTHVGMDNGIFGVISIYGAMNCDCVCPIGYVYDEDSEECVTSVASPAQPNTTTGYWTLVKNLYTAQITPSKWQQNGCSLYGVWTGAAVDYTQSIVINTNDLPLLKDIITNANTGPNHIYRSTSGITQIGVDLGIWNTLATTSYINDRVKDIAIWLDQGSPITPPAIPVGEWIGCITEINFQFNTPAVIALCSDSKMRMKVDGIVWIDMAADENTLTTYTSNYQYFNLFPISLPGGLHTISFEVYSTTSDAMMAFEVYINQDAATNNYFIGDILGGSFSAANLQSWILQDANNEDLSSKSWDTKEIQLGTTYGYSCTEVTDAVSYSSGALFCIQDATAPCEVPLDCGYCLDSNGVPQPQWTKKGPCVNANDGGVPTPALLGNVWVTDYSELSDLVECPGALANTAYARIMGALATRALDIRQIWMTIIIRHLLHNLNACMTLSDIQDLFTGFLDDVCPTCDTDVDLTPAQMEALTSIFTLNTNSNFDF
jgi:hypothetical protein